VWGTDVYTDDSDIVCAVMHCGYYNASLKKPVAMVSEMRVVIQLLPPQIEYPVFVRNGIRSRAWWAGGTSCSYKVHHSSSSHDTSCLCTSCSYKVHPSSSSHDATTYTSCLCTSCSYKIHPLSSSDDAATHTSCLCMLCSPPLLVYPALKLELAALAAHTRCMMPHLCLLISLSFSLMHEDIQYRPQQIGFAFPAKQKGVTKAAQGIARAAAQGALADEKKGKEKGNANAVPGAG